MTYTKYQKLKEQSIRARTEKTTSATIINQNYDEALNTIESFAFLSNYFKTLRLVNQGIEFIDELLLEFKNLEDLSLTGNLLQKIEYIPQTIQILHLNANKYIEYIKNVCILTIYYYF